MQEKTEKTKTIDIIHGILVLAKQDLVNAKSSEEQERIKQASVFCIDSMVSFYKPTEVLPPNWRKMPWSDLDNLISKMRNQSEFPVQNPLQFMPPYCI